MLKNLFRIFKILKKREKITFFIISFFTVLATLLEMISLGSIPIYVSFILEPDKISNYLSNFKSLVFINEFSKEDILVFLSVTLVFIFILKSLFLAFFHYFNGLFLRKLNSRISREIYNNYLYSDYLFYTTKTSAEFTRNIAEVSRFVGLIGHYIRLNLELLILFFIILVTIKIDPFITIIALFIFGLFSLIYLGFIKNWLTSAGKNMQSFTKFQINLINQTFSAIKEIKINLKENYLFDLFSKNIFKINKIVLITDLLRRFPKLILEVTAVIFVVLISLYFIIFKSSNAELISVLSYIAVATIRLVPAFTGITAATSSIKYMEPSINIIQSETMLVKNLKFESIKNSESIKINKNLFSLNEIKINKLNFSYNENLKIIDNLDLVVKKNQKIGIVGLSGMGKTTLFNLMLGLIKANQGDIFYEKFNINEDRYKIYNSIGYVPQDTILFNDSFKNNITFGEKEINYQKLKKICEIVKIDDFILNLKDGLDTKLGERGINISGGQKQRIGLARALYKDPSILFLDESTSSLDLETENDILKNLFLYCKEKIIVFISHRSETLKYCDIVYKLKNGKLIKND